MAAIQHIVFFLSVTHSLQVFSTIYTEDVNATSYRDSVKLGGLFSLQTDEDGQCGQLRTTVVERVEAMVFAIREINKDPTILPSVNLTFDIRSTCSNRDRALEETLDYVHDSQSSDLPVSAVMGPTFSDSSILVANILNLFQIPQISYASTAATLSDKSRYGFFFRTIPSDALQSRVIADLVREFKWTYIFAFYSADTYGEGGINSLEDELKSNDNTTVCLALKMSLPLGALSNNSKFDDAVGKMSMKWVRNASVAVLFGHLQQAVGILSAVDRALEIDPDSALDNVTWIAPDSWALNLEKKFYERARGMLAVHPRFVSIPEFSEYFVTLTPNSTRNPWFREYWELNFNCSFSDNSKKPCNLETQTLPRNKTLSVEYSRVVQGIYAFGVAIHKTINTYCPNMTLCDRVVQKRSNGRKTIKGTILKEQLLNVSLFNVPLISNEGLLFDRNGDIQSFSYTIYNLRWSDSNGELAILPVGHWDHESLLKINLADIQWRKGGGTPQSICSLPCSLGEEPVSVASQAQCCWTCRKCLGEFTVSTGNQCQECQENFIPSSDRSSCIPVPLKYLTWSSPFGVVITILIGFGIVGSIATGVIYAVFFNHPVMKASSRELSVILLCGILFCYCLPLLYLIKPTPASCAVLRVCSGLCFATVFSPLVVKTNRIHRIFNRVKTSNALPRFVSPASQIVITLLLMSIQVVIAFIWLAAQSPGVKTVLVNRKSLELVCDHNPNVALVVTVMYNLILLGIGAGFAFRTRKVPEHFNESKFISTTVFSLCVVWMAFVPTFYILATVEEGLQLQSFSLLVTVILSASITLCCLLIPKVFLVFSLKIKKETIDTVSGRVRKSSIINTDK